MVPVAVLVARQHPRSGRIVHGCDPDPALAAGSRAHEGDLGAVRCYGRVPGVGDQEGRSPPETQDLPDGLPASTVRSEGERAPVGEPRRIRVGRGIVRETDRVAPPHVHHPDVRIPRLVRGIRDQPAIGREGRGRFPPGRHRDPARRSVRNRVFALTAQERRRDQGRRQRRARSPHERAQPLRAPAPDRRRVRRCPFELEEQVARALPALVGVLGQAPCHEMVELRGAPRLERGRGRRLGREDRRDQVRLASIEGPLVRQHLVQHGPEGEDVAAGVGFLPLQLLRRHVGQGSQQGAFGGESIGGGRAGGQHVFGPLLGQAEIEQLRSGRGQHDVGGLEIAVDDPRPMRVGQGTGDLHGVLEGVIQTKRPP